MSNKKHILMKKQKLEYSPNINKLRYFVFTPILCMIFSFTFAQQAINGIVLDENSQPIPGVSILEKGTNNGVETDFDGNYSIDVSSMNSILVFSSIGFSSQEVAVEMVPPSIVVRLVAAVYFYFAPVSKHFEKRLKQERYL